MLVRFKSGIDELPAILGGGIVGIAVTGLGARMTGLPFSMVAEAVAAAVGMCAIAFARRSRFR